jgi:hypothetical protein
VPAEVVVIGLDAAEALIERWTDDSVLPPIGSFHTAS